MSGVMSTLMDSLPFSSTTSSRGFSVRFISSSLDLWACSMDCCADPGWNLLVMVSRPGTAAAGGSVVETLTGAARITPFGCVEAILGCYGARDRTAAGSVPNGGPIPNSVA
jgi:hypothetical protein